MGECQEVFEQLKVALCTALILAYLDPLESMMLDMDASAVGVGAVLSQVDTGRKERVLGYASQALNKLERNYCVMSR